MLTPFQEYRVTLLLRSRPKGVTAGEGMFHANAGGSPKAADVATFLKHLMSEGLAEVRTAPGFHKGHTYRLYAPTPKLLAMPEPVRPKRRWELADA